jgi:transketolase
MPQQIRAEWEADGWGVMEIDGHDLEQLYTALQHSTHHDTKPHVILAHTVMGKGVSFMENDEAYHGAAVKPDRIREALKELGGFEDDTEKLREKRKNHCPEPFGGPNRPAIKVHPGEPIFYGPDDKSDNRGAWGRALMSIAEANMGREGFCAGVFDCDLSGSVKTKAFGEKYPESFFQFGISEHATAVTAGALSSENALSVFAAFGVFGVCETYNQARLNDINHTNLKLVCTHSGVNVGEDGKTHQCIDYFGLLNSTFGWKVITPADPNQTDRVCRYALATAGNFAVIMGRSVVPIITDESGRPLFGEGYEYRYGRMDLVRTGEKVALVCAGNMLTSGLEAWNELSAEGKRVQLVSVSDWSDFHADDLAVLGGFEHLVVLEDHNVNTGLGTAIGAALMEAGHAVKLIKLGVTGYAGSGKPGDLYRMLGLDGQSVAERIRQLG